MNSKPAFPLSVDPQDYGYFDGCSKKEYKQLISGMTLREYAAVAAMQGLLANSRLTGSYEDTSCAVVVESDYKSIQRMAVKHADALLARLEESK